MKKLITYAITLVAILTTTTSTAQTNHYNINNKLAVEGYDVVSYFTQNKAVKGSKENAVLAEGVTYYFSTTDNKELFKKDAKKYMPQYGGWCAYAMGATGEKVEIDPETFKILNGKLYLFYHTWINNTLTKWNKDEVNLKKQADANWQKTITKN